MDDDGARAPVDEIDVQHIQGIDRDDARDEGLLGLAIQRLGREAAGIDLAAFRHELGESFVHQEMTWESLIAKRWEAFLESHGDAWAIEQDGGLVTFAQQASGDERVDETDGTFMGDAMKGDESFLAWIGLHIFEDFFFIVDEDVAVFVSGVGNFWHDRGAVRIVCEECVQA